MADREVLNLLIGLLPLDGLGIIMLNGKLTLDNSTVSVYAVATLPKIEVVPGILEIENASVSVSVAAFRPSSLSMPAMAVSTTGIVHVGGDGGFSTSLSGSLDTANGSAQLAVRHAGGWSPLTGDLADIFSTTDSKA